MIGLAFVLLSATVATTLAALAFRLFGVLAAGQVDDLGADVSGDLFQFRPAHTGLVDR